MRVVLCALAISSLCSSEYFQDSRHKSWKQSFEVTEMIHQEKTDFGDVAIFENPVFGRVFAVDGRMQTTERDEAVYHEMLVHPALLTHGKPSSVLIIGGGDGGALREVLRHKDVEKVVLVEINSRIIDLSKEFMPALSKGAFDDPRVTVVIQDVALFVKESQAMFDIILCDFYGPGGTGAVLLSSEFYGDCKSRLNKGGILINQNGVPFMQNEEFTSSIKSRKAHFATATFYIAPVPTYTGGFMAFGWASDMKHSPTLEMIKKRFLTIPGKMKYYSPAIQKAAFTLPSFMLTHKKSLNSHGKTSLKKEG